MEPWRESRKEREPEGEGGLRPKVGRKLAPDFDFKFGGMEATGCNSVMFPTIQTVIIIPTIFNHSHSND